MTLLAIETATRACSVALVVDGRLRERSGMDTRMHADVLLPWIQELLAEAGIGFHDLDALAVDRGPGGFTSLRIGLGVTQGIALAHDLPCHPVSSLAALALAARPDGYKGRMLAATDARMDEIYAGWFDFGDDGKPTPVGTEMLLPPADFKPIDNTPFIAAGDALENYANELLSQLQGPMQQAIADAWPTATAIAELASHVTPVEGWQVEPVYLRDKVAHQHRR